MESNIRKELLMEAMEEFFIDRTRKHIGRVQAFCEQASEFFPLVGKELMKRADDHDKSKFFIPERKWYIVLTWRYKMQKEGKDFKISDKDMEHIRETTFHHCKTNPHHPEYWCKRCQNGDNPVDSKNREKRLFLVDAHGMDDLSIIEMVCDWSAMSQEHGEPGPKKWADESIKNRWSFSKKQQDLIYEVIDLLWR
jgi:hypothetical protein